MRQILLQKVFVYLIFNKEALMIPDSKVHWANMGTTWVLSAPDGPHVGAMNLAIRDVIAVSLDMLLNKPSTYRWYEAQWRLCNVTVMLSVDNNQYENKTILSSMAE